MLGSSEAEAQTVAANLVLSNLKGHDSHGVGYLPRYIKGCVAGLIQQDATAEVVSDTPTMVLLDGHVGFGQSLGKQAMALGIPKALEHGVAVVGIRNSHHLARIGAWPSHFGKIELLAAQQKNIIPNIIFNIFFNTELIFVLCYVQPSRRRRPAPAGAGSGQD